MGIFFDQDWFDDRLKSAGLSRAGMAQAAGMTVDEIEMVFSDRRELEGPEVHAIARFLSVAPRDAARERRAVEIRGILTSRTSLVSPSDFLVPSWRRRYARDYTTPSPRAASSKLSTTGGGSTTARTSRRRP